MTTAAILLSRQPLRPCAKTPWVEKVTRAVEWIKENNLRLITSTGMQTWEIQIAAGLREKIEMTIVIPASNRKTFDCMKREAQRSFDCRKKTVAIIPLYPGNDAGDKKELPVLRDRYIIDTADLVLPVSIRKGGLMENLTATSASHKINNRFRIDYCKRTEPIHYHLEPGALSPAIQKIDKPYIIHWTRASNVAWPTERKIDYYQAVLKSPTYPRTAFDSLCNILTTQRICASSLHMPDTISTVSFSDLPPADTLPLIKWRSRYRMMSFEPYGIGIEKEYALTMGILPVVYYSGKPTLPVDKENHYLLQSRGKITDWRQEREFRYKGDFHLGNIPREKPACFCCFSDEAQRIEKKWGIRAYGFLGKR
ncbi:MAG: hypothetical protein GF401_04145 [Chitinivibrionales bacterium]|nr:hypothetical protein [Chitinivibrionales bacterium]